MILAKESKSAIKFFLSASVAALLISIGIFYYVQAGASEKNVLGEKIAGDANSLFGSSVKLVKTANEPKVYAVVANQKYLIRNEEAFYSYDFNFTNVSTVSTAEINKYPFANLVKEAGTGRIYYLSYDKNLKKYHPSPEAFNAYPGNNWGNIIEVSQKDLSFWQDANLLKAVNDNKVYYVVGGKKAWVKTENEFNNSGFDWQKILTVFSGDLDTYANIDFSVDLVKNNNNQAGENQEQNQNTTVGKSDGQLVVTVDKSSPQASVIPLTTAGNTAVVFKIQAIQNTVTIDSVFLTKKGVINDDAISLITVEDENGVEYGRISRIDNSRRAEIRFMDRKFVVVKNQEKRLMIKVNISEQANNNSTFSLGIDSNEDINSNGSVSGVFPAFGSEHKLIAVQDFVGVVYAAAEDISSSLREINIGVKKETISKFTFKETSGNEDVAITKITFYNEGTAADDDLDYIYLYEDSKKIASSNSMVNGIVSFDLSANPIKVAKNKTIKLSIKVDIAKGEDRTLKFVINEPSDVVLKGLSQDFNLALKAESGFPVGKGTSDNYNKVVFKREGIGFFAVSMDDDEKEVYREAENAVLAEFELRNISQDIYLQRVQLQVEKFNNAPDLDSNLVLQDVSISKDIKDIVSIDKQRIKSGVVVDVSLNNYKVESGKNMTLSFFSDIPESAETNAAYRINIKNLSYKIGSDNTSYDHGAVVLGQVMKVLSPKITITKGELKNKGAAIAGNDKIELANFSVTSSMDESIRIKSVTVTLDLGSDDVTYVNGFSNLALYLGSSRKSEIIAAPNSRTYTFNDLNIKVSENRSISLMLKADSEVNADGLTVVFKLDDVTAEGYSSRSPALVTGEGAVSDPVVLNVKTTAK